MSEAQDITILQIIVHCHFFLVKVVHTAA